MWQKLVPIGLIIFGIAMWVTFCFVVYIMEMPRYNDILSYPHYISF